MLKKGKKESVSYGIVGLGRFGYALTLELARSGADLLVIDRDEEKIKEIREFTENALVVHSLDKKTLLETGIQNCDVAVVCIGEQMEFSILTTLNLVSMGIPRVVAKASGAEHGEILSRLGAEVVFPERDMAVRLAKRLEASTVLDFIQLGEQINISKVRIPDCFVGKSLLEVDLRSKFGVNIIAVENHQKATDHVSPEYVFRKDDILIVAGKEDGIIQLSESEQS